MIKNNYTWGGPEISETNKLLLPNILDFLSKYKDKNCRILDLGCGTGYITNALHQEGFNITGADGSKEGISIANKHYPECKFLNLDANDLIYEYEGKFDIIILTEVIEHVFSPKTLMEEIFKILSNGGMVFISTPYHGYFKNLALALLGKLDNHFTVLWEFGHIKFFSIKTLKKLLYSSKFIILSYGGVGRFFPFWKSMFFIVKKNTFIN